MTWPNFFIAGAPKAGTTSLYSYLIRIPGIFMAKVKEPNFFSRELVADDHPMRPIRDERQYLKLFADAGDAKVIGEATPSYLADKEAAELINRTIPHSKILVSLRDPVERAYSHYLMMVNNGRAKLPFLDEIKRGLSEGDNRNIVLLRPEVGLYSQQVQRFREEFGDDRFKILIFEEFKSDVPGTLRQVLSFLGIEYSLDNFEVPVYRKFGVARGPLVQFLLNNRTITQTAEKIVSPALRKFLRDKFLIKQGPKPPMDPQAREFLIDYYNDDVQRLSAFLERPLPWRNFSDEISPGAASANVS